MHKNTHGWISDNLSMLSTQMLVKYSDYHSVDKLQQRILHENISPMNEHNLI